MSSSRNLHALTALRFFPAMWVVLFDYWRNLGLPAPAVVAKGYLGVEVFFTLSGFILCHVYLGELERGAFDYGGFLKARLARIYPLHLASLAAIGAMALAAGFVGLSIDANILSWASLPANLLLVQAWGLAPVAAWNHPSWSISAEWFAYLSFPLFGAVTIALRNRPLTALATATLALAGLYAGFEALSGWPLTQATIRWGALRIAPCFAYGCALYLVWRSGGLRDHAALRVGAWILAAFGLIFAQLGAPDALIVLSLGAVIPVLAERHSQVQRGMIGRSLTYLGEISYAIYMLCIPWGLLFVNSMSHIAGYRKDGLPVWAWLFLVVGLIPLSAACHHLVERPGRIWIRGLGRAPRALSTSVA